MSLRRYEERIELKGERFYYKEQKGREEFGERKVRTNYGETFLSL